MKKNMKKNLLWMLLSLMAATIMMPLSATAQGTPTQTRIAVVSDIHVMAPSLLPEGAETTTAWTTYYAGQRKMLQQSAGLFDQFVTTLTNLPDDKRPHVLLITGDLTKDGEQLSHDCVKAGLQTLESNEIQVYVIPGNHDFGEEGNHKQYSTNPEEEPTNVDVLNTANFASFYTGYGYGIDNDNNFVQDPNGSLSYVAEIADGLYLLAIDSHNSSVNDATLDWICDQAQVIRGAGKRVIAMMHHPLFPHITGAELFATSYTVANYTTVRDALIAAGVNVILTGHFHTSDIAYDWIDNTEDPTDKSNGIYDINTGSLISYPCDYRMLTLTDNTTLSVETQSLTPTGRTADECKTWLHDRVESIAKNKMIDNAGEYATIDEITAAINNIAKFAADLFILHAKGDENSETNKSEREELESRYSDYKNSTEKVTVSMEIPGFGTFPMTVPIYSTAFTYGGITDESIYSILTDISNYVDGEPMSDHENRTADRTLSGITLTTLEPSSTLNLSDDKDIRTAINCYDGKTVNVRINTSGIIAARLSNRASSLYKDGAWNTICLPFNIDNLSGSSLEGAIVKTLESSYFNSGELTLNFSENNLGAIEYGKPYILKWKNNGEPINSLSFDNVTINKTIKAVPTSTNRDISPVTFVGTYEPRSFNDDDDSILLIGSETQGDKVKSTLFYPKAGASIGVFRAYFQLAEDPAYGPGIRNFVLNFGDDDSATGIIAIGNSQSSTLNAQRSEWFTLDGRRLAAKPTAKGLYIHAGKKVVIK